MLKKTIYLGDKLREIKFRAWDSIEKKMVDSDDFAWVFIGYPLFLYQKREWHEYKGSIILMQFTGLKDKNGKEIYEGDIVNQWDGKRIVWFAEYGFGALHPKWDFDLDKMDIRSDFFYAHEELYPFISNNTEVIGNIYQNIELLK